MMMSSADNAPEPTAVYVGVHEVTEKHRKWGAALPNDIKRDDVKEWNQRRAIKKAELLQRYNAQLEAEGKGGQIPEGCTPVPIAMDVYKDTLFPRYWLESRILRENLLDVQGCHAFLRENPVKINPTWKHAMTLLNKLRRQQRRAQSS